MLNQTVGRTSILNCVPKTPLFKTQTLSLSPCSNPFFSSLPQPKTQLRCSILCNYNNDHHNQAVSYPRPSEVPWKKELCNSVSLIGIVGAPVEIKHLSSGKVLAWTRLAVRKSASDTTWWSIFSYLYVFSCLFWTILLNRPKSPISLSTCGVLLEKGNSFAGLTSIESLDGSDK